LIVIKSSSFLYLAVGVETWCTRFKR